MASKSMLFTKKNLGNIPFSQDGTMTYLVDTEVSGLKLKVGKKRKTFLLEKRISGRKGSAAVITIGTFPNMSNIDEVRKEARRLASLCEQGHRSSRGTR